MPDLKFRAATQADIPAIVDLVQSAYRGDSSRAGWTTEADILDGRRIDPQGVREPLAQNDSVVLLGEIAASLQACAHVACVGGEGYFGMFAVAPDRQSGGIGSRMLAEAERRTRDDWNCTCLGMTVIDLRDELIAWYQRRGYARTGRYKPFPYGDERFGIPKRDDLRFEWLVKNLTEDGAL